MVMYCHSYSCSTKAELSRDNMNYDRGHMACKTYNIYCLALHRKKLLMPELFQNKLDKITSPLSPLFTNLWNEGDKSAYRTS